jgi:hypothetical protein
MQDRQPTTRLELHHHEYADGSTAAIFGKI